MNKLISTIMRGVWAIEPSMAKTYFPQVALLLQGKEIPKAEHNFKVIAGTVSPGEYDQYGVRIPFSVTLDGAMPGSVARIPIDGPIMKNDYCGSDGTASMGEYLKIADAHPNIAAIVLHIDSPGGAVDGTQALSDIIRSVNKPVVAFVDGMMASAALWIGSSAKEIMASTPNDIIGSIGTMMSFADFTEHYKAQGVTLHEVYADKSTDKNGIFKAALNRDYAPLKEELLNPLNETFINAVKANRAGKYDLRKENIFTGKTYLAKDAITHGLADSIGTLDDAIARAKELANNKSKIKSKTKDMNIRSAWKGIMASLEKHGVIATDETVMTVEFAEHLNADLEAKTIELEAKTKELSNLNASLEALKAEKATLETEKATLATEKENAAKAHTDALTALEAKVAELSKTPAVQTPAAAKEADKDGDDKSFINPNATHNQLADKITGKAQ